MAVHVVVDFRCKPGKKDELAKILSEEVYPTLEGANGFRGIELAGDVEDADHVMELETWDSADDHRTWVGPVFTDFGARIMELLTGPPSMSYVETIAERRP